MNILDLNNKIFGYKNLKEGAYANFIMGTIEEQEIANLNIDSANNPGNMYKEINKEIKL